MPELRPWVDRVGLGRIVLANMYGITETTVHSTFYRITRADLESDAVNRIGRPLADLQIHLLDGNGQLVPIGVPGEIYVGGPGVTRGYLNRPALTAQRFVPDPFGPAGSRLYRSGDLARRRPDGSLEFCGRIDDQVKIRGYRVELGEIALTLSAHPDIRDASWSSVSRPETGACWPMWCRRARALRGRRNCAGGWPGPCPITWCRAPSWHWTGCR